MSTGRKHSLAVGKTTQGRFKDIANVNSIYELSNRTRMKVIRRMNVSCCLCGWNEEIIDIHHIISRKNGGSNNHSNLTPLCPNHHRLANAGKIGPEKFTTLETLWGDSWKLEYFG